MCISLTMKNMELLNPTALLGAALFLAVAYGIGMAIYRVWFHPLAKFPGPWLYGATRLPSLYHFCFGNMPRIERWLHGRYGPVVRYAPDRLTFIDPRAWKDILGHRAGGRLPFEKDRSLAEDKMHEDIIFADDETHSRQRRIFSHAFSDKALREQENLIRGYVDFLVLKLQEKVEKTDEAVDLVRMFNFTTFDVMSDLTFGEPLGMLKEGEYVPWVTDLFGHVKYVVMMPLFRHYPFLKVFIRAFLPKSLLNKKLEHERLTRERVDRRLEIDDARGDIWDLVKRNAESNNIPRSEMYANANIFMIAGTETSATLLSGLVYLLCKNPQKMRKLLTELRGLRDDDLSITRLAQMPYLHACIEEALRLYPPAAIISSRVIPRGGAYICGSFVPEGTVVGIAQNAAYRSSSNFAHPDSFVPERWLSKPPEDCINDKRDMLQPFSYGPRNCLGKNLAYHEMRLILSSFLRYFDVELEDAGIDWLNQKNYIVWEKHPLMVKLKRVHG